MCGLPRLCSFSHEGNSSLFPSNPSLVSTADCTNLAYITSKSGCKIEMYGWLVAKQQGLEREGYFCALKSKQSKGVLSLGTKDFKVNQFKYNWQCISV